MSYNPEDPRYHDLAKLNRQLEEANDSLEQFVYVASHDLREPLAGIAGYASLLRRRYGDQLDEQGRHFLDEMVNGCQRMETKIDDLLELSRAGRGVPNGPIALGSALDEAKKSLVSPIKKAEAAIFINGSLPMVRANRSMIAQVFQNLLSNSIKYRKPGEPPLIEVKAALWEKDPRFVLVAVRDNGIGFDMKHVDRIFGVFQRLYTIEQYSGTGIGLAIAKKIIDVHGGKIWAESEEGKGSTFFFTLPKV